MVQQVVNIGSSANDNSGDPLRTAFTKINQNFTELYGKDAAGANFDFTDNTLTTTNTNGDIILDPNGTGVVVISDDRIIISAKHTPLSSVGAAGDKVGMICWDEFYLYVCSANYDGTTDIWKRVPLSNPW